MSLMLNIDTALEKASVCLAKDDQVIGYAASEDQKDHASWLHPAINELLFKNAVTLHELKAVAVNNGPGSYTGLRVGLSAAKGLCYALNIPLITVDALEILAFAVKEEAVDLICPMIDARRMEVFTCIVDKDLGKKLPIQAMIIDESSFVSTLTTHKILFCGTGMNKLKKIISHKNAFFSDTLADATHLARLSHKYFQKKNFADVAYAEPSYVKGFYTEGSKKK